MKEKNWRIAREVDECYRQRARQLRQRVDDLKEIEENARKAEELRRHAAKSARANKDALPR